MTATTALTSFIVQDWFGCLKYGARGLGLIFGSLTEKPDTAQRSLKKALTFLQFQFELGFKRKE